MSLPAAHVLKILQIAKTYEQERTGKLLMQMQRVEARDFALIHSIANELKDAASKLEQIERVIIRYQATLHLVDPMIMGLGIEGDEQ